MFRKVVFKLRCIYDLNDGYNFIICNICVKMHFQLDHENCLGYKVGAVSILFSRLVQHLGTLSYGDTDTMGTSCTVYTKTVYILEGILES